MRPMDTFLVTTTRGVWRTRNIVLATGYSDRPLVPAMASRLDGGVHQVVPSEYRNPAALPGGGVLVVGASATGIQLADEIHASGRQVVLSTGHHLRVPRRYRGRDIMWWLDRAGILDETEESVYDVETSRQAPSFQLVGRPRSRHAGPGTPSSRRRPRRRASDGHRRTSAAFRRRPREDHGRRRREARQLCCRGWIAWPTAPRSAGLVDEPEPFEPLWPAFVERADGP